MKRFSFQKGIVFIDLNNRWELRRRLVTGQIQLESQHGEILNLKDNQILERWQTGEWMIDPETIGSGKDVLFISTAKDLASYSPKQQAIAEYRLHYLKGVDAENSKLNKTRWNEKIAIAAKTIGDENPPCPTTVHNWKKLYEKAKDVTALIPKTRREGSKKGSKAEVYEEFLTVINKKYLNNQRYTAIDIREALIRRISILNTGRKEEERLKPPARATIYDWLKTLRADVVESARFGSEFARFKYRSVTGKLLITKLLERVEFDHTPVDLVVIDIKNKLVLGRPWLTAFKDYASKMVLGFYISFNHPNANAVLQCLKQAILPKDEILKRHPEVKGEWPAQGIPNLVAMDNGMAEHSEALKVSCMELAITMLFCPAETPWLKGTIERDLKKKNHGLIHKLPGTTFSGVLEKGDYDSEEESVIDINDLNELMLRWIVDIDNYTPQKKLMGETPLSKWKELAKQQILELPLSPRDIDLITGIPAKRTIFHYGIELSHLHYNSKQLQEIRRIDGTNLQVMLKFYHDQVAFIDVLDPFTKEYIRVPAIDKVYTENLHRQSHIVIYEIARKKYGENMSNPQLLEARHSLEERVEEMSKSTKRAKRKMAAALSATDTPSILSGKKTSKIPRDKRYTPPAPEALESGLDDDLPDIKRMNQNKDESL